MADGSRADGSGCVEEVDSLLVNNDSVNVSDLKNTSENVSKTTKVKMSFYVENNSDENSVKSEEPSVDDSISSFVSSVPTDKSKHVQSSVNKDEDNLKKRCADRYDSSESSDSGVAVLSICGSSSSDITEPGSPYSPASSASSASGSEGAPGEGARPPWPWVPATTSSPIPTNTRAKRPRADKCTNLESLITRKLHKNAAMPAHPEPAANYNNNILINTEEKKSNTQTSQHCCIQRSEEIFDSGMPTTKVLNHPQSGDCTTQISSIPKHIIHKAVPQQLISRTPIVDRPIESKLKDDRANQLKIQQGRITEYYKSQMKPNNGLKKDYATLIQRVSETKEKLCVNGVAKSPNECNENLGNYLSYLSQTFNSKMPINNKVNLKPPEHSQRTTSLPVTQLTQNTVVQKVELEKKPIPALNPILNAKNVTPSINVNQKAETFQPISGLGLQNKTLKEVKSRTVGSKLGGKRSRTMEGKKSVAAKVTKSSQTVPSISVDKSIDSPSLNDCTIQQSINNNSFVNGIDNVNNRQITLSAIHDHMRKVFLESKSSDINYRSNKTKTNRPLNKFSTSDRVPSIASYQNSTNSNCKMNEVSTNSNLHLVSSSANLQSSISNSLISATSAPSLYVTSSSSVHTNTQIINTPECQTNKQLINSTTRLPNVSVPPATVMLTAIRIPQPNMQQPPLVNSDGSRNPQNHIAISPTKINGQFVLPMVQNINGALVQIPSLVTKVGQNTMLPLNSQNLIQRTENIVNHQQTTQMYINGTLLKINGPMHPNLSGLIAKQMTATSTTNVSYTVTQKNLTETVPAVMTSKPNFAMNINHPMFVSSPGFILNPMAGVVTAQSSATTTIPVQQQFGGNVVLTTSLHPNMHVNHNISSSMTNIPVPSANIPISPIKLGDINRVFLTPTRPLIPKMTIAENAQSMSNRMMSNTRSLDSKIQQRLDSNVNVSSEKSPLNVVNNNLSNDFIESGQLLPPAVLEVSSATSKVNASTDTNQDSRSLSPTVERCKDVSTDSTSIELSNIDNSLLLSEETKNSIDSISDNSATNTNSIETPLFDISKEIYEDLESTNPISNDNSSSCIKSPLLVTPHTIRFPPKLSSNDSRNKISSTRTEVEDNKMCRWNGCVHNFDDSTSLLEHLQDCHVNSQAGKETYTCLWEGCRVYNRPSCSRCWLERHVLSHGGTKLFRCIVDGCGQRFNTQLSLQRHVNNHFSDQGTANSTSVKKSIDAGNIVPKLIRRNGKKLRFRRQPWSARMFDFFDAGIMEGLQYRVSRTAAWRTGEAAGFKPSVYSNERSATSVTLSATIIAKRLHNTKKFQECLVSWTPSDVLQDEWLPEKDFIPIKEVQIKSLDASARDTLYTGFCSSYRQPAAIKNSSNGCFDLLNCHNNPKTDSLVNNTANESHLVVSNHTINKIEVGHVMSKVTKLSGAAKRKQWKR